jgi:DNA primase
LKPSESHKNWLTQLAHRYHDALTPEVLSYLESRGLGPDVVRGALLGLVADPDPAHEQYRGRLSIPFLTPTGVVAIRFRCLKDHVCEGHGKYEGVAGATTHLYNVQALHDATTEIGIAEGELDALVATSAGLPTVGCVGASSWKPFYYRLFDDFQQVYVLGDGDSAGRKWAAGLVSNIPGAVSRVQPADSDVTTHVLEVGAEAWLDSVCLGCNPDTAPVE